MVENVFYTDLLTHVDHSAGSPDTEHQEQEDGDGEEYDDQCGGSLAQPPSDCLDLSLHGGHWSGGRGGGGWHNAAAVVCLHHHPHLTLTLDDLVLRGAVPGDALCKLGALTTQ